MRSAASPRPFPWGTLDSTTRADADVFRGIRGWAASTWSTDRLESAFAEVMGARIQVLVRRVERPPAIRPIDGAVAVVLSYPAAEGHSRPIRVEVERALAAAVVARVIRRPPPAITNESRSATRVAGAFAAVVAAAARRGCRGDVFRVESATSTSGPALDPWWIEASAIAVSLTVLVDDDAYLARVGLPMAMLAQAPGPVWGRAALRGLGGTPLSVPVVACAWSAKLEEMGALRAGDVVIPEAWPIERSPDGSWRGTLWLAPPGAAEGVRVAIGDRASVVLGGELDRLGEANEASMGESDETSALVATLGEVAVVVRVELGEATLAAREWAALGRGDVIGLGRRLGERVVLRVGGVAMARGELVDIDGELGVRIAERIREQEPTTAL